MDAVLGGMNSLVDDDEEFVRNLGPEGGMALPGNDKSPSR
jgi:general stress protein YciG